MNKPIGRLILVAALGAAVAFSSVVALSATPAKGVSARKHPNIEAAQRLCAQAFDKITAAQKTNEFDMAGHAARAKDLIEQASAELKQADESLASEAGAK